MKNILTSTTFRVEYLNSFLAQAYNVSEKSNKISPFNIKILSSGTAAVFVLYGVLLSLLLSHVEDFFFFLLKGIRESQWSTSFLIIFSSIFGLLAYSLLYIALFKRILVNWRILPLLLTIPVLFSFYVHFVPSSILIYQLVLDITHYAVALFFVCLISWILKDDLRINESLGNGWVRFEKLILGFFSIGFFIWSCFFIFRSSSIAIDGKRYFCLFDDAMISMRYAWNFAHGIGLVWNDGEKVQGFTNLLMTLIMSVPASILSKSNSVLSIQFFGVFVMLVVAYVSTKISDEFSESMTTNSKSLFRILTWLGVLLYYPLVYWTLMGMETGLLTLLILSSILFSFRYIKNGKLSSVMMAAFFSGMAYLVRPDALIYTMVIWLYLSLFCLKSDCRRTIAKDLLFSIGLIMLFIFGKLLFQYMYYGSMLPNTYTLKLQGMPFHLRLLNGVGFIGSYLKETSILLVIAFSSLFTWNKRYAVLLFATVLTTIVYQIYTGGDPWNYWRILAPTMPLIIILVVTTSSVLISIITKQLAIGTGVLEKLNSVRWILITCVLLTGLSVANLRFWPEISFKQMSYLAKENSQKVNVAVVLRDLLTDDASIGVFWAGTIPYYSGKRAIDFLGKSDKYIAMLPPDVSGNCSWYGMQSVPGHNKYNLEYSIKTLLPTYVEKFKYCQQDLSEWSKSQYVSVNRSGVEVNLRLGAPEVRWDRTVP